MPRDRVEVRRRLQQAALELFQERGYEVTTAAEIAARAGVTERTFFRHFIDKREVLFDGAAFLTSELVSSIATAPPTLSPWDTLFRAFCSVEQLLVENRAFSEPRQHVIANSPALQERESAKHASIVAALASALRKRGVADGQAALAAQVGMAIFTSAVTAWLGDDSTSLEQHLVHAKHELRALSSATS